MPTSMTRRGRMLDEAPEPDEVEGVSAPTATTRSSRPAELGHGQPKGEPRLIGRRLDPGGLRPVALLGRIHAGSPSSAMAFS